MAKLFFLFSGEHETLPISELKAVLEAENHPYKELEKLDQAARFEASKNCVKAIKHRAALTRICGLELFDCKAELNEILRKMQEISLKEALDEMESFVVRIKRVKTYAKDIDALFLERKLGEIILNKTKKAKVNLKNPNKTFIGILTSGKFIFGIKMAEIIPKPFTERRPKKKPFFHPSAMQPKLARCMVNLARPKTGDLLLDPFCGTGGMLIEAALIGCRIIGLDIQKRMVKGTLENLEHYNIKPEGIIIADAKNPPVKEVDCVVTDPPYGKSASTLKRTTKQIIEEALQSLQDTLKKGGLICMAAPKSLSVGVIASNLGYKHLDSHFVYVHRSLTREITVLKKV